MESFDPTISKEAYSLAARLIEEFDKMEVIVQGYVYVALELFPTLSNLWLKFVQYIVFTSEYYISWLKNKYSKTCLQRSGKDRRFGFVISVICNTRQVYNM